MFLDGFENQATKVVVSRLAMTKLVTQFAFWHGFSFVDTVIMNLVFYVMIDGLFGELVKVISP